jgi:regulation of enolase protein 1 (concanavalin A-like superfamily)
VTGDGTITARLVSATGVAEDGFQKIGVMIRESDAQGSAHAAIARANRGTGAYFVSRPETDGDTEESTGFAHRVLPLWMRVQRAGDQFSAYLSRDGQLWTHVGTRTVAMGDRANFGLFVMSHDDSKLDTAEFDNLSVQPGVVSVSGLSACGSNSGVLLQWNPVRGAQSYNVYRSPAGTGASTVSPDQLQKINSAAVTQASYTDNSAATFQAYAVAAVTNGEEGARVVIDAGKPGPQTAPAGFTYSIIGENQEGDCAHGSVGVSVDANGVITMRSGGHDIWDDGDDLTFLHQKVSGNFRITVSMLSLPSATNSWAKAGPMIRETTDRGSRQTLLAALGHEGSVFSWRTETDGGSASTDSVGDGRALQWNQVRDILAKGPLFLRLTRSGDTITPEYSVDGTTFQAAGAAVVLEGLNQELEVGVGHTSHDVTLISEVQFRDIKIEKL